MTAITQESYVLASKSGNPLLAFDCVNRAMDVRKERARKGVNLRLFKRTILMEEIT